MISINILVTLNRGYVGPLTVMLKSLVSSHCGENMDVYVMNSTLCSEDYESVRSRINCDRCRLIDVKIDDSMLNDAPVTDRYPKEMYYRIFASKFLPEDISRILYLDPDLVVIKDLSELYNMDMDGYLFAAATHVNRPLRKINNLRIQSESDGPYINSGVMLMNIEALRREQDFDTVFEYIRKRRRMLFWPDQDIISAIYSNMILDIDPYIYNMSEKLLFLRLGDYGVKGGVDLEWVRQNSAIIHYCGRNKPWKENYFGLLGEFYFKYENMLL